MSTRIYKKLMFAVTALLLTNCSAKKFEPAGAKEMDNTVSDILIPEPIAPPPPPPTTTMPPTTTTTAPPTTTTSPPPPPTTTLPPVTTTTQAAVMKMDSFQQDDNKVDILIVDDNSPSMDDLQRKMSLRFQNFTSALTDVDYHIAITTTDVSNGKYGLKGSFLPLEGGVGKVLTPDTPNSESIFLNTIYRKETVGCFFSCPSSDEQALNASIMAMDKRDTDNAGFFRDNVSLAIVMLTDEDEISTGGKKAKTAEQVIAKFQSIWGSTKQLKAYGIIVKPNDTACMTKRAGNRADGSLVSSNGADRFVKMTGGLSFSVCDADYSQSMAAISQDVRKMINVFTLSDMPKAGTVSVKFTPVQDIGFKVQGQQIIFDRAPSFGTHIDVNYEVAK